MNKLTTILMSILLLGIIVPVVAPTAFVAVPSHAGTNNTIILQSRSATYPYAVTTASINISAYSGSDTVVQINGGAQPGVLDINLSGITISSGSVTLYSSTNGVASIGSGDVAYATLPTSYITATVHGHTGPLSGFYNYTSNGETYGLGNDSIVGPSPSNIAGGSYYIKANFGSSAPIATSTAQLIILPSITLSPTSGGAGTPIKVTGTGFTGSSTANVTYSYRYDGASSNQTVTKTGIATNSTGGFTYSFNAPEKALNETTIPSKYISVYGNDTSRLLQTPYVQFTELPRSLLEFQVTSPSGTTNKLSVHAQSDWNTTTTAIGSVYITEPIRISGNNFDPSSTVSFTFGGISLGSTDTNATGYFNTTLTIPIIAAGVYPLNITDPLAYVAIHATTEPTLIVTPTTNQPGATVTINGYGFGTSKASNITLVQAIGPNRVEITRFANLTSSSSGTFTTTFTLPTYITGGIAVINASTRSGHDTQSNPTAYTNITIVPELAVTPTSASIGSTVVATAMGLSNISVTTGIVSSYGTTYTLHSQALGSTSKYFFAYDNIPIYGINSGSLPGTDASLTQSISAVGTPEIHEIQLINASSSPASLIASVSLNVTGSINGVTSQVSGLATALASIEASLTSITSSLTSITSSLTSLSSAVTSISSGITNIEGTLSSITSSLSSISGTLTSMGSTLTSIQTAVSGLNTSSLASTLSSVMTYLLVVAVLAIIIIVLEIVLLVRKK